MIFLGIETSCDETACGIVSDGTDVKASIVSSQIATHAPFGGVVPEVAAREHLKNIEVVVEQALTQAGLAINDIDAIAVSQGPGLIGALLVGASYAKGLAAALGKPLVPIDHVHAHVHGALLAIEGDVNQLFPCLSLVVSGGHTNLYYMEHVNHFDLIAFTNDDACGECFDKVAKLLGFAYPGGPIIERMSKDGDRLAFPMPVMMEERNKLEFSYSGLKTHMVNLVRKLGPVGLSDQKMADLCASFQEEALMQIVRKLRRALEMKQGVKSVLVAGGVSANQRFKELVAKELSVRPVFPALAYCSDNGAMIAASGFYTYCDKQTSQEAFHWSQQWDAYSRYQFVGKG